jgi:hypothetical protein
MIFYLVRENPWEQSSAILIDIKISMLAYIFKHINPKNVAILTKKAKSLIIHYTGQNAMRIEN